MAKVTINSSKINDAVSKGGSPLATTLIEVLNTLASEINANVDHLKEVRDDVSIPTSPRVANKSVGIYSLKPEVLEILLAGVGSGNFYVWSSGYWYDKGDLITKVVTTPSGDKNSWFVVLKSYTSSPSLVKDISDGYLVELTTSNVGTIQGYSLIQDVLNNHQTELTKAKDDSVSLITNAGVSIKNDLAQTGIDLTTGFNIALDQAKQIVSSLSHDKDTYREYIRQSIADGKQALAHTKDVAVADVLSAEVKIVDSIAEKVKQTRGEIESTRDELLKKVAEADTNVARMNALATSLATMSATPFLDRSAGLLNVGIAGLGEPHIQYPTDPAGDTFLKATNTEKAIAVFYDIKASLGITPPSTPSTPATMTKVSDAWVDTASGVLYYFKDGELTPVINTANPPPASAGSTVLAQYPHLQHLVDIPADISINLTQLLGLTSSTLPSELTNYFVYMKYDFTSHTTEWVVEKDNPPSRGEYDRFLMYQITVYGGFMHVALLGKYASTDRSTGFSFLKDYTYNILPSTGTLGLTQVGGIVRSEFVVSPKAPDPRSWVFPREDVLQFKYAYMSNDEVTVYGAGDTIPKSYYSDVGAVTPLPANSSGVYLFYISPIDGERVLIIPNQMNISTLPSALNRLTELFNKKKSFVLPAKYRFERIEIAHIILSESDMNLFTPTSGLYPLNSPLIVSQGLTKIEEMKDLATPIPEDSVLYKKNNSYQGMPFEFKRLNDIELSNAKSNNLVVKNDITKKFELVEPQLNHLSNVNISNPQDWNILVYDTPSANFVNVDFDLNNLNDVEINKVENGDVLMYDKTFNMFINQRLNMSNLDDVDESQVVDDSVLTYDSYHQKYRPRKYVEKVSFVKLDDVEVASVEGGIFGISEYLPKDGFYFYFKIYYNDNHFMVIKIMSDKGVEKKWISTAHGVSQITYREPLSKVFHRAGTPSEVQAQWVAV